MPKGRKRIPVEVRFGMVVVDGEPEPRGRGRLLYPVKCDCGGSTWASSHELRAGKISSCGCVHVTHGETRGGKPSPEYTAHQAMLSRCYDKNDIGYDNYGGREIVVCERWRNSVVAFIEDIGRRPSPKHSVDRIDSNGNYEPGNVRWATDAEQNANKRNVHKINAFGEVHSISEWSRLRGVPLQTLWRRIVRLGWDHERALTEPVRKRAA